MDKIGISKYFILNFIEIIPFKSLSTFIYNKTYIIITFSYILFKFTLQLLYYYEAYFLILFLTILL